MNPEVIPDNYEVGKTGISAEAWRLGTAWFGSVEFANFITAFHNLRNQSAHRRSVLNTIKGRLRTPCNNVLMLVDSDDPYGAGLAQLGLICALNEEGLARQNILVTDSGTDSPTITPRFGNSVIELDRLKLYLDSLYRQNRSALVTAPVGGLETGFMSEHLSFILPVNLFLRENIPSWQMELPYSIKVFPKKASAAIVSHEVELRSAG